MTGADAVLISTYLEPEHVQRIRAAWSGEVLYAPELLPVPAYAADHGGTPRDLDADQLDRWRALLARAQIAFDFDWWAPAQMAGNCPHLRWVQATSAGIGGFVQRHGLDRSPVVFTTAAGVHAAPLAEFAVTGALYIVKDLPLLLEQQRRRCWQRYTVSTVRNRRVTVVGMGQVGQHTATLFTALGAQVTGVARPSGTRPDLPAVTVTDSDRLDGVLTATDILVLACPLTAQTHHLLDARRLALLPSDAVLINIARGAVVDQDALIDALRERRLAGAALDVTDPEPLPADSPLWEMSTVLISPHSGSTVAAENAALTELFVDNLQRWRTGRPLRNEYRRDVGY